MTREQGPTPTAKQVLSEDTNDLKKNSQKIKTL